MKRQFAWVSAACAVLALWTGTAAAAETVDQAAIKRAVDDYLSAAAAEGQDPSTFRAYWKDGLKFDSGDGNFKLWIGGRLMFDQNWISSDDYNRTVTADRTFFRRIRLEMGGTVYKNVFFKVQLDFAGQQTFVNSVTASDTNGDGNLDTASATTGKTGDVTIKDVYMGLKGIPGLGTFTAGHMYEPFGLETQTSSKYISFLERSVSSDTFSPGRNSGVKVGNSMLDQRMTWAVGVFRDVDDQGRHTEDGSYNITLRITGLALKRENQLLHLGVGFSYRAPNNDTVRYRARPGTGAGERLIDTGNIAAERATLIGLEGLWIFKQFHVQAEWFMVSHSAPDAAVGQPANPEPDFSGGYVEVAWWITGEMTAYKGDLRGRTRPKKDFFDGSGSWGAWMLAARFDQTDLADSGIAGGEQNTITVGLNWHWNPNTRIMFNFVNAAVKNGPVTNLKPGNASGRVEVFEIRFQFDF